MVRLKLCEAGVSHCWTQSQTMAQSFPSGLQIAIGTVDILSAPQSRSKHNSIPTVMDCGFHIYIYIGTSCYGLGLDVLLLWVLGVSGKPASETQECRSLETTLNPKVCRTMAQNLKK